MYDVTPQKEIQMDILRIFEDNQDFDFWSELRRPGYATTIMVSPNVHDEFLAILDANEIPHEMIIEDVET